MNRCAVRPYEGKEPYIFVSYSHRDNAAVFPVIERLVRGGYRVWYDEGIDPGSEWSESIAQHLAGSTVCLVFLSKSSCASQYCKQEINYAHSLNKSFVAIKLDDVVLPPGIDLQLSSYQFIFKNKYSNEDEFFEKLYDAEQIHLCSASQDDAIGGGILRAPTPVATSVSGAQKKKSAKPLWFIALGAILIVLILLAVVFLQDDGAGAYLGDDDDEPEQSERTNSGGVAVDEPQEPATTPEAPSTGEAPDAPPITASNALTISVEKFIYQNNSVTIVLNFDNRLGQKASLGWAGACDLVVTTEDGVFSTDIFGADYEIAYGNSERTFEVPNCTGEIKSIVITNLRQLGTNGLPENEAVKNAVIYDVTKGSSACICDFETGSHESTESDFTPPVYAKPQLEPQEGALLITVEKIEDQDGTKVIWVNFDNRTGYPVKWEWGKATYLWVYTDANTIKVRLNGPELPIDSSAGTFTVENCPGAVESIVISNLHIIRGFNDVETATSIVIYDAANGVSSALCFD